MLAARITDMHVCPMVTALVPHVGGPIIQGQATVLTGNLPQARLGDMCTCAGPPDTIVKGSSGVLVGGQPAARLGDNCAHGGVIIIGHPTVMIGETSMVSGKIGVGMMTPRMGTEGGDANQVEVAQVMTQAAKDGTPFCEQCQKGA